ncbi:MAG: iron-containing alcohol dehydrogenase [Deltaproteobacteria bacterium]|nr:iron-containing alcohol dehydrogenase [Deltaproteobacteria bacterium]
MRPMRDFDYYMPTKIRFGPGVSSKVGEELRALGGKRVLVVTDAGIVRAKLLEDIAASLDKAGISHLVFDEVEANATISKVLKGSELQKKMECDILLSIGGGSVMDAAKAIGILATNPGPLTDYEGPEKYDNPPLPTVAVATTAGTGSEVSFGAVVFDEERCYKLSIRSAMQIPKVAFLDPLLLKTTPPRLAAATGMDALSHALEAYVSQSSTFITDALCRENFHLVGRYLRRFVADPSDTEAAGAMLQASSMGAMAFNTARLGIVHAMAHPLGARFSLHHGVACGILLPHAMRFNLMACPQRYIDVAVGLEGYVQGHLEMGRACCAVEAVERLLADTGVQVDFSSTEITEELLSTLSDETLSSGMQRTNPRAVTKEDVMNIFRLLFQKG